MQIPIRSRLLKRRTISIYFQCYLTDKYNVPLQVDDVFVCTRLGWKYDNFRRYKVYVRDTETLYKQCIYNYAHSSNWYARDIIKYNARRREYGLHS